VRLPVVALGFLLRRDHSPIVKGDILVIKMQGGGSLVLAFPALLSIKRRYHNSRLLLLTTRSVAQFGESLGVFDEVICVDDRKMYRLFLSGLRALWRCFRVDTVLDFEVYSRLTTVFSVLTAARNRIGFYLESAFWRKGLHTHLVFFNRFASVHYFYEQVAQLLDAPIVPFEVRAEEFIRGLASEEKKGRNKRIAIGHACSEMGAERMLTADQWLSFFLGQGITCEEFAFLGAKCDYRLAQDIIEKVATHFPVASFKNLCGLLTLAQSIAYINSSDEFWGIDSALLHYARLLGKKTVSFWGPTDPMTRLGNSPQVSSEIYYRKVPCSPCIHVAESPPCGGQNLCIQGLFNGDAGTPVVEMRTLRSIRCKDRVDPERGQNL